MKFEFIPFPRNSFTSRSFRQMRNLYSKIPFILQTILIKFQIWNFLPTPLLLKIIVKDQVEGGVEKKRWKMEDRRRSTNREKWKFVFHAGIIYTVCKACNEG